MKGLCRPGLERALSFPSFTVFETTTCLFVYYPCSGNTFCGEFLLSHAFAFHSVPFELTGTFRCMGVRCCTASQQKQNRKEQPPFSVHPFTTPFLPTKMTFRRQYLFPVKGV